MDPTLHPPDCLEAQPAPRGASGIVCVFAKAPEPGRVKTRLAPVLGAAWAADLAGAFLVDTWHNIVDLPSARPVLVLSGAGRLPELHPPPTIWPQGDGDLGARLERGLRCALASAPWALAIGTDSPGLPRQRIEDACAALSSGAPSVIGPSEDGGYYLIGLRRCPEGLFDDLPWSTSQVFAHTVERLRRHRLDPVVLDAWYDVDEPSDLARLRSDLVSGAIEAEATLKALRRKARR
ncbi:MAG TPA: TIGR04282 family arsenosugar biosynthesis glycosyltransferase [Polyangiaceae bacterium]|nr:TIGR04282 family arsenosugar biosynthesis glycosyltransferase [Polyangiaceae bacterium]